jgi:hypothetical protein
LIAPGEQRIYGGCEEGEAIDASDGRQLQQCRV